MDHYVQYHNSEKKGLSCQDFDELDYFGIGTNKPANHLIGSQIWLIGGEGSPRKYYLCYTFIVDTVEKYVGEDFLYDVSGSIGIQLKPVILLNHQPWFNKFLRSQQNFSLGLRKLDPYYVNELEKLIPEEQDQELDEEDSVVMQGAGFGSAEMNRLVESAAISCVVSDFEQRGWSCDTSKQTLNLGYDLECTQGDQVEHVEVKGVKGADLSFIITSNEVKKSQEDPNFILYVVTSALTSPKINRFTAAEFLEQFSILPISYRAKKKNLYDPGVIP